MIVDGTSTTGLRLGLKVGAKVGVNPASNSSFKAVGVRDGLFVAVDTVKLLLRYVGLGDQSQSVGNIDALVVVDVGSKVGVNSASDSSLKAIGVRDGLFVAVDTIELLLTLGGLSVGLKVGAKVGVNSTSSTSFKDIGGSVGAGDGLFVLGRVAVGAAVITVVLDIPSPSILLLLTNWTPDNDENVSGSRCWS